MSVRSGLAGLALAGGLLFTGCGGGEGGQPAAEPASPSDAIAEIAEVRKGLDEALATYESGDAAAADEQVGTAYLEHFEHVEGPLEEADHELKEELEHAIREELRAKIRAKAPQAEVKEIADGIDADLTRAETALR
jgi:hypothetical protein